MRGRDSNPRPLDRESDALPQHHDATNFPVASVTGKSPTSYEEVGRVASLLRGSYEEAGDRLPDHLDISRWSGDVANFLVVANLLRGSWRRRQQVREEITGKLVPVEFELNATWR